MTLIENGLVAVVDDDASMRNALRRWLFAHGYQAQVFASAEEFLLFSVRDEVACVISDIELGEGMSGLELGETMLAGGYATPIIFVTCSSDTQLRRRALLLGCIAVLGKPFSAEALLESVAKAVTGKK